MTAYRIEQFYEHHIEPLSLTDRLQLVELIVHRAIQAAPETPRRRQWRELRGAAAHPFVGEDAQAWVSRSRQEDDYDAQ